MCEKRRFVLKKWCWCNYKSLTSFDFDFFFFFLISKFWLFFYNTGSTYNVWYARKLFLRYQINILSSFEWALTQMTPLERARWRMRTWVQDLLGVYVTYQSKEKTYCLVKWDVLCWAFILVFTMVVTLTLWHAPAYYNYTDLEAH